MSEIIVLRTQIIDNMEMLNYPDLQLCRFVLTLDIMDDDNKTWHVFLDKPARLPFDLNQHTTHGYNDIRLKGEGDSPEDAYKDLLKWTAEFLHHSYDNPKKM
ncbi:hypothetical protein KCU93_g9492, partial [Aureobasidium melanogenum]